MIPLAFLMVVGLSPTLEGARGVEQRATLKAASAWSEEHLDGQWVALEGSFTSRSERREALSGVMLERE